MKKKHLIELRNSLRRRGFWVEIRSGEFVLDRWYSKRNFYEMLGLLTSLEIHFIIGERGFWIDPNTLVQDELLSRIESFSREEWRTLPSSTLNIPPLWNPWDPDRFNDLTILELDSGIASLVFALNKVGFYTSMSCDGHGRREPKIWFNGHDHIETLRKILAKANLAVSFAYDWEVRKEDRSTVLTARKRLSKDQWDVKKIQDDALALSEYLYGNDSLNWKRPFLEI